MDESGPGAGIPELCRQCLGCIQCEDVYCIHHARGDPGVCNRGMCMYCVMFVQRERLFLHNVG